MMTRGTAFVRRDGTEGRNPTGNNPGRTFFPLLGSWQTDVITPSYTVVPNSLAPFEQFRYCPVHVCALEFPCPGYRSREGRLFVDACLQASWTANF